MLQRFPTALVVAGFLLLTACEKKENNGIAPTYGGTGNPNPNAQTVTGTSTATNPATENTSLQVGGTGWSNLSCTSTLSLTLKGTSGTTEVTLSFATPIKGGTYTIAQKASGNTHCAMLVKDPPGQPAGVLWYGKSGVVAVNQTTSSISAAFTNIVCTQQNFNFPTVTASGFLGCSP